MNNKQWYEVFIDKGKKHGTETLKTFDDLVQALVYKYTFPHIECIHIDKWENTDSPRIIEKIE